MNSDIPRIDRPEMIFGFVAPIGSDIRTAVAEFEAYFRQQKYDVINITVTDVFKRFSRFVPPILPLVETPLHDRYSSYISYGNTLRKRFLDNSLLAKTAIFDIIWHRNHHEKHKPDKERFSNTIYLISQFKRKEEVEIFRQVYGRLFFQVSIYSRRSARIDNLARKFAHTDNKSDINSYRDKAETLVQCDMEEIDIRTGALSASGQSVGRIFHDADFIINADISDPSIAVQVNRFCELLFGSNSISPNKSEYGMLAARSAALRSLDLSRQVGAAIFTTRGEIVALGSNEVPKAGGGTYWSDEHFDDREFRRGEDSNDQRKREILKEITDILGVPLDLDDLMADKRIKSSQFMDALEYGRIVHAEMSALSDAARLGRPIKDCTMYTTTFPCHMCAKHIVAAGIKKVVFLEPYPKSLAFDLHSDSITVEGTDRGKYEEYPSVRFEHFCGITPRRYRDMFPRGKRKKRSGEFLPYNHDPAIPTIDIRIPIYVQLEAVVVRVLRSTLRSRLEVHS